MEIKLRGVKKNRDALEQALKKAFANPPQVTIEDESDAGGTLNVTVIHPDGSERDQKSVSTIIDTVAMRHDYVFCSIDHQIESPVPPADTSRPAFGWHDPTLTE